MWISLCLNLFSIPWASWIYSFIYFAKFGRFSAILQIFFLHYILLSSSSVMSLLIFPQPFSVYIPDRMISVAPLSHALTLCSAFSHWAHPVKFYKFLIYPLIPKFVILFFLIVFVSLLKTSVFPLISSYLCRMDIVIML